MNFYIQGVIDFYEKNYKDLAVAWENENDNFKAAFSELYFIVTNTLYQLDEINNAYVTNLVIQNAMNEKVQLLKYYLNEVMKESEPSE